MNEEIAMKAFGALSNETRLRVVKLLVAAGPEGSSAGDIAVQIGASPSRASFHLSALSETGMVTSERQARSVRYFVDFQALGSLANFLLEDCCQGNADARACCEPSTGCC